MKTCDSPGPQTYRVGILTAIRGWVPGDSQAPSIDNSVDAADVGVRATPWAGPNQQRTR